MELDVLNGTLQIKSNELLVSLFFSKKWNWFKLKSPITISKERNYFQTYVFLFMFYFRLQELLQWYEGFKHANYR